MSRGSGLLGSVGRGVLWKHDSDRARAEASTTGLWQEGPTRLGCIAPGGPTIFLYNAMKPAAIGLSGRIGTGKSAVAEALGQSVGWSRASFGDYVRSVADEQGLGQTRDVLQELGAFLVAQDITGLCQKVLRQSGWGPGHPVIIDGIRHYSVLQTLRQLVSPLRLFLVYLEASDVDRRARLMARESGIVAKLEKFDSDSTEVEVTKLAQIADLKMKASDHPTQVAAMILEQLEAIHDF